MELNDLKNAWQNVATPAKSDNDMQAMLSAGNHPVLKGIRRQVVIEVAAWSVFLLCYYTMFDGDEKPLWLNAVLIISVLFPLLHNLMGYNFARYLVNGDTIKESLSVYLAKVKTYAAVSIGSRMLFALGFVVYFSYGLNITTAKYYALAILGIVFTFQLWMLFRMWNGRIVKIENSFQAFK